MIYILLKYVELIRDRAFLELIICHRAGFLIKSVDVIIKINPFSKWKCIGNGL
jgi:hypothetical protein